MGFSTLWLCRRRFITHAFVFVAGILMVLGIQTLSTLMYSCYQEYDLLEPTLRCDDAIRHGEWDYEPLRDTISLKKQEFKASGKLSHISIYFRDLVHGPRFGIGEYDKFHPASLTKVLVLIEFLHEADSDPDVLDTTLSFSDIQSLHADKNVEKSAETIQPHTLYTIRELLTKMIVYSDNYSYKLLMQEMNAKPHRFAYFTFRDLDVLRMMLSPNGDFVSILQYGNLFAVLYNTGYLSREMSQLALKLLSQATYGEGLVAGTPEGTVVAHKFGYRNFGQRNSELHDCGIVYHPAKAYILCVMTSGTQYEDQKAAIAEISRIVYEAVSLQQMEKFEE